MKTKTKSGNVGYAVVGLGRGMDHVRCASNSKNCDLLAVCDINPETFKKLEGKYEADTYTDIDKMLKRDDIDIVSICTPSGTHAELAMKVAEAGKHAMLEKPFDITLDKIDATVKAFADKGLKLGLIFQNRFAPANRKAKQLIDEGVLGDLILGVVQVKWYRTQGYYDANGGWRGTWAMDGGGSLMNQGIHTVDLFQWMMGPVKSVFAYTDVVAHNIEAEDITAAVLKMKNGVKGIIITSTATYPGFGTTLDIHGVNGGICMKNNDIMEISYKGATQEELDNIMKIYGPNKDIEFAVASDPSVINRDTTHVQIQDMIDAVLEDRPPVIEGAEGRRSVEIINAIYESAKTGKEISL
jgi:UDP-N-acetyl-2-amino-2-deoxyglucuronate dehydrogenase